MVQLAVAIVEFPVLGLTEFGDCYKMKHHLVLIDPAELTACCCCARVFERCLVPSFWMIRTWCVHMLMDDSLAHHGQLHGAGAGVLMRRLLIILVIFWMLQGLGALEAAPVQSQDARVAGCRYFPATGHNVQGEFLAFFDRYGGETLFGQPRTEVLVQDGVTVQYFDRVRMELHPSNPAEYRVQLGLFGDLLGYRQPPIPSESIPPFDNMERRYYPQTGHTLSYVFLHYYDTHGGLDVFGYPIAEMENEGERVVQYFQRGKMEWHPENPISSQVTLGALANDYILTTNAIQPYLASVASACSSSASASTSSIPIANPTPVTRPAASSSSSGSGPVAQSQTNAVPPAPQAPPQSLPPTALPPVQPVSTDFSVSAAVRYRITGQGGTQTLYVRAVDSQGRGVGNAAVQAIVHFQTENVIAQGVTDGSGSCCLTFSIGFPPPGYRVIIDVRVNHAGRTVTSRASFTVWS
jgi:hypothetical protein